MNFRSNNAQISNVDGDANKNLVDFGPSEICKLNSLPPPYGSSPMTTPGSVSNFNIVTLNVSGLRFQTFSDTLDRYPKTLLGNPRKRQIHYNNQTGEYFFDRHRSSFQAILYFYQSCGRLKRPESVPVEIFVRELKFYEMGADVIEKFWQSEGYRKPKDVELPKNIYMKTIWQLMEHPDSSFFARVMAFFSVFVIILSTLSFCLETIPCLKYWSRRHLLIASTTNSSAFNNETSTSCTGESDEFDGSKMDWRNVFFVVEFCCICWFSIEFILRFISCPSKVRFCKSFLNIIDVVAIVPFFINLYLSSNQGGGKTMPFAVLRIFRLVRVFRIFKLSRHSRGLQILGKTFKASVQELCLLIFFLILGLVLFSSAIYFAENDVEGTQFDSIPAAFWFTIVTMTTVGYGDMTPKGPWGKLVGSFCAIVGVLVLALPVPVIVANFKHYYRQEKHLSHMQDSEREDADDEADDDSGSS